MFDRVGSLLLTESGGGGGGGGAYLCQDGSSSQFRSLLTKLSPPPVVRGESLSRPLFFKERASLLPRLFEERTSLLHLLFKERGSLLLLFFEERAFLLPLLFKDRAWEQDCSICMTLQLTFIRPHSPEDDLYSKHVCYLPSKHCIKRIIFGRQTSEGLDD